MHPWISELWEYVKPLGTVGGLGFLADAVRRWRNRARIHVQLLDVEPLGARTLTFKATNEGSEPNALKNRVTMTAWAPKVDFESTDLSIIGWERRAPVDFKIADSDLTLAGLQTKQFRAIPFNPDAVHPLLHFYTYVFRARRGRSARVRTLARSGDEVGLFAFWWHLLRARRHGTPPPTADLRSLSEYQANRDRRSLDR